MFMVGSFAAGLSEGLDSGWKLGKDIQERALLNEARDKAKAEAEKQKAGNALPSVAAKPPSVNDPDVPGPAGLSAGQTNLTADGYDPDKTYEPTKTTGGRAGTGTTQPPWQSKIKTVPDYDAPAPEGMTTEYPAAKPAAALVPPATGPVVATAAIPPPPDVNAEYQYGADYTPPGSRTRQGAPAQPIGNQLSSAWSWARGLIPTPGPAAGTGGGRARTPAVPASTWGPMPPPAPPPPPRNQGLPTYLPRGSTTMPGIVGGNSGVILQDQPAPATTALPPPTSSLGPFEAQPGSNDRPVRYDPRTGQLVPY